MKRPASIELPEAHLLARQLQAALTGRRVRGCELRDAAQLQKMGFVNPDARDFDALAGRRVIGATSRGSTIVLRLERGVCLVIAPEYGGLVLLRDQPPRDGFHLRLDLDRGALTVRLTGMGALQAVAEKDLASSYVYRRDFLGAADPLDERAVSAAEFSRLLGAEDRMLKAVLVGKDAVVVGLGNATFQDVAYRARVHPKRRASSLDAGERRALHAALRTVLGERLRLGGKEGFVDVHGAPGRYVAAMGPGLERCPACGTAIAKIALAGGPSYCCPGCQRER